MLALPWWLTRPVWRVREDIRHIRWRTQRFRRGWADIDAWNINAVLCETIPKLLRHAADHGVSHPPEVSHEFWTVQLREVADDIEHAWETWHETADVALAKQATVVLKFRLHWLVENLEELWD